MPNDEVRDIRTDPYATRPLPIPEGLTFRLGRADSTEHHAPNSPSPTRRRTDKGPYQG
jgi:hypothetical protein